jgi:hypothetical protein
VRIPAGNDLVTFHYEPRHLLLASILSLGASGFLVILLGVWLVRRRRPTAEVPATGPSEAAATDQPEPVS